MRERKKEGDNNSREERWRWRIELHLQGISCSASAFNFVSSQSFWQTFGLDSGCSGAVFTFSSFSGISINPRQGNRCVRDVLPGAGAFGLLHDAFRKDGLHIAFCELR